MDSLRYWVDRDARRRLPLRPRVGARARAAPVDRLGSFFDVLRQDPVLSPRQADRRALGPRRGRLPGRQFPVRLGGVERPYRDTMRAYWKGDGGLIGEFARRLHRLVATCTARTERAAATPASTSSPRTTASRCTTSFPTTRSTTRPTARTTATAQRTTCRGTAAPRARPTTPRSCALRERQQRNFLATLLLSQGVPMLLAGDEIGPHPARQQQRLLPGQRGQLARLDARRRAQAAARLHHATDPRCAARTRSFAGATSSRAGRCRRRRAWQGHAVAQARRHRDERARSGSRTSRAASACTSPASG